MLSKQEKQEKFFESLFRRNFKRLERYAYSVIRNHCDAEELAQDTLYTALTHLDKLVEHEKPEAYLTQVLRFKIMEYNRKKARLAKLLIALGLDPSIKPRLLSDAPLATINGILEDVMKELDEAERRLFERAIIGQIPHEQLSKELNISVWASQQRVRRLRKKLAEALPDY